jgi:polar amino acid transport system ATP-binding protein
VVAVNGPSGSRKSTLLRCIHFLETWNEGSVLIDGQPIGPHKASGRHVAEHAAKVEAMRREIGMIFQQFNFFRHMTALQNVGAGPIHVLELDRCAAEERAMGLLAKVGLKEKAHSYPQMLSGGQQPVAIARSLAMRPKEATSALDRNWSKKF